MPRPLGSLLVLALLVVLLCVGAWGAYALIDAAGALTLSHGYGPALGQALSSIVTVQLFFVMVLATLLTLAERKWSAAMQDRIGPNRARFLGLSRFSLGGLPHILADAVKMLTKEDFLPAEGSRLLFHLAPILNFGPVFCLFAVVPMGPPVTLLHRIGPHALPVTSTLQIANPGVGLLYVFGIASLAVYGVSLAGWASGNKLGLLGGVRASSQLISYEVALGLGLVGMMMITGTLRLDQMVEIQSQGLFGTSWLPAWGIFLQPLGFLLFFTAAFAETKRTPFDLPEGESEIIGYFIEYSGMKFGMFMIAEFIEIVTLSGIVTALFFGGFHLSPALDAWLREDAVGPLVRLCFANPARVAPATALALAAIGATIFMVKTLLLCWLQLAIRWTFPRFRYDQIQRLGWRILLPLGLLNVFATGLCLLLGSGLDLVALLGVVELGVALAMVLWSGTSPSMRATPAHAGGH